MAKKGKNGPFSTFLGLKSAILGLKVALFGDPFGWAGGCPEGVFWGREKAKNGHFGGLRRPKTAVFVTLADGARTIEKSCVTNPWQNLV